jgi:hypothetical protein
MVFPLWFISRVVGRDAVREAVLILAGIVSNALAHGKRRRPHRHAGDQAGVV